MSIIYSRRKRIKHKMRLQILEEHHATLVAENERVRTENKNLEALLKSSIALVSMREQAKFAATARILQRQSLMSTMLTRNVFGLPRSIHGQTLALNLPAAPSLKAMDSRSTFPDPRLLSLLNPPSARDAFASTR
jgi:regulator of replication initiation timing